MCWYPEDAHVSLDAGMLYKETWTQAVQMLPPYPDLH